jgi:hypothetical protein
MVKRNRIRIKTALDMKAPVKLSEQLLYCQKNKVGHLKLATLFEPRNFKKFNKEKILDEIRTSKFS